MARAGDAHLCPAANSRTTIDVSAAVTSPQRAKVSARITSAPETPILVERAMYLDAGRKLFGAGHASAGVTTLAPTWSFAEGATGTYFDTFILLANPSDQPTTVRATFLLPDGGTIERLYPLPAKSHENIWVDQAAPELANTAVSTVVESVDDLPFLAERAMWWPGPTSTQWREAHNSPGALASSTSWGLAEGMLGGPTAVETYVLIANTSPFEGTARVTLTFEDDGSQLERTVGVAASSRVFSGPYLGRSQCPAMNQVGHLAPGATRVSGNFTTPGVCGFLDDVSPGQQVKREFMGFVTSSDGR